VSQLRALLAAIRLLKDDDRKTFLGYSSPSSASPVARRINHYLQLGFCLSAATRNRRQFVRQSLPPADFPGAILAQPDTDAIVRPELCDISAGCAAVQTFPAARTQGKICEFSSITWAWRTRGAVHFPSRPFNWPIMMRTQL
jgi:hypothetical protein